eukprot:5470372-Pleurochrysis_carterae.AAC.2
MDVYATVRRPHRLGSDPRVNTQPSVLAGPESCCAVPKTRRATSGSVCEEEFIRRATSGLDTLAGRPAGRSPRSPARRSDPDGVLVLQPLTTVERDEELRTVRVGPAGRHRQQPAMSKTEPPMTLILEWLSKNGLATVARASWVTRLCHETFDDTMENAAIIIPLHAELNKVSASKRRLFTPELDI